MTSSTSRPARTPSDEFGLAGRHARGQRAHPQLFTQEEFAAPDGSVNVGSGKQARLFCARHR